MSDRISDVLPRLRASDAAHAFSTLVVMAERAHSGPDEFNGRMSKPKGHLLAPNVWLQEQCGISKDTVTRHVKALVRAGEIAVWEPHNRRQGRATEYVIVGMMTVRAHNELERRRLFHRKTPPKTKDQYSAPTRTTEPPLTSAESKPSTTDSRNPLPTPPVIRTGKSSIGTPIQPDATASRSAPDRRSASRVLFTSDELRIECPGIGDGQARGIGKVIDNLVAGGHCRSELIADTALACAEWPNGSMLYELADRWGIAHVDAWEIALSENSNARGVA